MFDPDSERFISGRLIPGRLSPTRYLANLVLPLQSPQSPAAALCPSPPPPAAGHRATVAKPAAFEPLPEIAPPPPPPPPPPPQVTAEDLKKITNGTRREDLLKLGAPASRIMMSDDGHLVETFSYADKDISLGRVRLTDGVVSSVEVR